MRWPSLVVPFTQSAAVSVELDSGDVDPDGEPVHRLSWEGAANWQDSAAMAFEHDRAELNVSAVVYIHGDPFPDGSAGGIVEAFGEVREIVRIRKNRNPDATVNNTELWLR